MGIEFVKETCAYIRTFMAILLSSTLVTFFYHMESNNQGAFYATILFFVMFIISGIYYLSELRKLSKLEQ